VYRDVCFIWENDEKGVSHPNTHTQVSTSHVTPFLPILFFTGLLVVTAPLFGSLSLSLRRSVNEFRDVDKELPDDPSQIVSDSWGIPGIVIETWCLRCKLHIPLEQSEAYNEGD
jgi:hypothetical protein